MLNKVILIGRLGADPEIRYMPSGDSIATLNLATSRRWKDRNTNERKEETEWHRVTFFGPVAKVCGDYLKKGSQVYVEGRIKTDKYQKDGVDVYRTGIVGEQMHMLDSRSGGTTNYPENVQPSGSYDNRPPMSSPAAPQSAPPNYDDFDDDIPF
jgi:single-strand DNA-binding protein